MTSHPRSCLLLATLIGVLSTPALARENDFPTSERVMYVHECMAAHPGPHYEMVSKCSCALDAIAQEISYDEYLTLSTEAKATTIGGERGSVMRDNAAAQKDARRWRDMQRKAQGACFIGTGIKP